MNYSIYHKITARYKSAIMLKTKTHQETISPKSELTADIKLNRL